MSWPHDAECTLFQTKFLSVNEECSIKNYNDSIKDLGAYDAQFYTMHKMLNFQLG